MKIMQRKFSYYSNKINVAPNNVKESQNIINWDLGKNKKYVPNLELLCEEQLIADTFL